MELNVGMKPSSGAMARDTKTEHSLVKVRLHQSTSMPYVGFIPAACGLQSSLSGGILNFPSNQMV